MAEKLAPLGSSQANESFNRSVLSKQSKAVHYSSSESCDYRVAAAVCTVNFGPPYIAKVNKELNLTPGSKTEEYRNKFDAKRKKLLARSKTVEFKRNRKTGKKVRALRRLNAENTEGVTYASQSGVYTTRMPECPDEPDDPDPVPLPPPDNVAVVIFDLESSGFGKTAEIVQIAAIHAGREFSCYILPLRGIPPEVTDVTKLRVESGRLLYNGEPVTTTPPRLAILRFIEYLKACGENVLLVAHNCFRFEATQLTQEVKKLQLWDEFSSAVSGFSDTLPLFKTTLSDKDKEKLKNPKTNRISYSQGVMVEKLLEPGDRAGAHNAIFDVRALCKLIDKFSLHNAIRLSMKPVDFKAIELTEKTKKDSAVKGFDCVKDGVSRLMISRLVEGKITLAMLKETFQTGGEAALHMLLGESVCGKPRVTNSKAVLRKISTAVAKL